MHGASGESPGHSGTGRRLDSLRWNFEEGGGKKKPPKTHKHVLHNTTETKTNLYLDFKNHYDYGRKRGKEREQLYTEPFLVYAKKKKKTLWTYSYIAAHAL